MRQKQLVRRTWLNKPHHGSTACSVLDLTAQPSKKSRAKEKKNNKAYSSPSFDGDWAIADCSRVVHLDIGTYSYKAYTQPPKKMTKDCRAQYKNIRRKLAIIHKDAGDALKFLEQWKKDNFKDER